jgi:hypothetical protein
MPNFAIHDGSRVVNVIVADDVETAESVTGMSAVETEGSPWIGWTMESEGWRRPAPFPSWTWDEQAADYVPPTPDPGDGSSWDEDSLSWIAPEPAPEPEA